LALVAGCIPRWYTRDQSVAMLSAWEGTRRSGATLTMRQTVTYKSMNTHLHSLRGVTSSKSTYLVAISSFVYLIKSTRLLLFLVYFSSAF